jgi:hypothetical protein
MNMTEFKIKYLLKLGDIEEMLLVKYPDKKERIVFLCNLLESKLESLQLYNLNDYVATILHARQEFNEFIELLPWEFEVEQLIKNK